MVLDLGSVLNKERVTTDVVDEVVLKAKMVDPMKGRAVVPALFFWEKGFQSYNSISVCVCERVCA